MARTAMLAVVWVAVAALGCRGCDEAPPFDPEVFITPEAVEIYGTTSVCHPNIGIIAPLPTCYPERPCDRVLPVPGEEESEPITVPTRIPNCETGGTIDDRGPWSDGEPYTFVDPDNLLRRFCLYDPANDERMPLVLFFHGTGGSSDDAYKYTSLRGKAETFDLGGPSPGFMLVSVTGRNLHWPTEDPRDGPHHDVFHRDLASPSENRDVWAADHIIDFFVGRGHADPRRIYVMGWSNGAHFAQMYGLARHETATPGGNRVAAVAAYSAGDPFHNRAFDQVPSCQLESYPQSELPVFLLGRSCDAIPCDDEQLDRHRDKGRPVAPGTSVDAWVETLRDRVGTDNVRRVIVDDDGTEVSECAKPASCGLVRALLNHVHWPDGIADEGGVDWEPEMLTFLRTHPLP